METPGQLTVANRGTHKPEPGSATGAAMRSRSWHKTQQALTVEAKHLNQTLFMPCCTSVKCCEKTMQQGINSVWLRCLASTVSACSVLCQPRLLTAAPVADPGLCVPRLAPMGWPGLAPVTKPPVRGGGDRAGGLRFYCFVFV